MRYDVSSQILELSTQRSLYVDPKVTLCGSKGHFMWTYIIWTVSSTPDCFTRPSAALTCKQLLHAFKGLGTRLHLLMSHVYVLSQVPLYICEGSTVWWFHWGKLRCLQHADSYIELVFTYTISDSDSWHQGSIAIWARLCHVLLCKLWDGFLRSLIIRHMPLKKQGEVSLLGHAN